LVRHHDAARWNIGTRGSQNVATITAAYTGVTTIWKSRKRSARTADMLSARPAARRALCSPSGGSERSERGGRSSARPAARRARCSPAGGSERSERGGRSSARPAARRALCLPAGGSEPSERGGRSSALPLQDVREFLDERLEANRQP